MIKKLLKRLLKRATEVSEAARFIDGLTPGTSHCQDVVEDHPRRCSVYSASGVSRSDRLREPLR